MAHFRKSGNLTFLRANEFEDNFGGQGDSIEAEVVAKISSAPNDAFGLKMRNDEKLPANEAMFALLRDSFNHDWATTVEYETDDRPHNGYLFRVELRK